jgi:hypothetical protein
VSPACDVDGALVPRPPGWPRTVSVALATFHGERHLPEQLASLARQTRLPDELVVVDDASTDGTIEVVERFAARAPFEVRVERLGRRRGFGEAFFLAFEACRGDLVAFCDQDDVWAERKLERCAAWFRARPELSLLVHAGRVVDEKLRRTGLRYPPIRRSRVVGAEALCPLTFTPPGFSLVVPSWLRSVADWRDRPPPALLERPDGHDGWVCLVAPAVGPVALVAEELVLHRRHGSNTTTLTVPGPHVPRPLEGFLVRSGVTGAKRPRLGGSAGLPGLLDVPAKAAAYRVRAERLERAARYLEQAAAHGPAAASPGLADGLRRRAELYRHCAFATGKRAEAVEAPGVRHRLRLVASLAGAGGYRARRRGGLGAGSLALDLALACGLGSRKAHPMIEVP